MDHWVNFKEKIFFVYFFTLSKGSSNGYTKQHKTFLSRKASDKHFVCKKWKFDSKIKFFSFFSIFPQKKPVQWKKSCKNQFFSSKVHYIKYSYPFHILFLISRRGENLLHQTSFHIFETTRIARKNCQNCQSFPICRQIEQTSQKTTSWDSRE